MAYDDCPEGSEGSDYYRRARSGEKAQVHVIFWTNVGPNPFGHLSVEIDGLAYSLDPKSWSAAGGGRGRYLNGVPAAQYMAAMGNRGYTRLPLLLTDAQSLHVKLSMRSFSSSWYSPISLNCVDPLEEALEALGFNVGWNVFPLELKREMHRAGVIKE